MLSSSKSYFTDNPEIHKIPVGNITKKYLEEFGCELLGETTKLFFDYDRKFKEGEELECEKNRKEVRDNILGYRHFRNPIVMTESIQPLKVSFHVIFQGECIKRVGFHPDDEKELFSKIVGPDNFQYIDPMPYGENENKIKWFRLPYKKVISKYHPDKSKPYPHIPFYYLNEPVPHLHHFVLTVPDEIDVKDYSTTPARINRLWTKLEKEVEEDNTPPADEEEVTRIQDALQAIHNERFQDTKTWYSLGLFMKHHQLTVEEFCTISKASGYKKYKQQDCEYAWTKMKKKSGLGILINWLREDNVDPSLYFPVKPPIIKEYFRLIRDEVKHDLQLANLMFKFFGDIAFYSPALGWAFWNKNSWELRKEDSQMYEPLMSLGVSEFMPFFKTLKKPEEKKKNKEESNTNVYNIISNAIYTLSTLKQFKPIFTIMKSYFTNEKRFNEFDRIPYLLPFLDGEAIDIRTTTTVKITKEMNIITTTGYKIPDENKEEIDIVEKLLKEIWGDEYDYNLGCISTYLYGSNQNEIFLTWTGRGRNGKGLVDTGLQGVLGNFYYNLPVEELTEESKGKGRASSELASSKWARCVMSTEPETNNSDKPIKLKTGKIKQLTGRDLITTRELHKSVFTFQPNFVLSLQCNQIPALSKVDDAITERMVVLEFPFQFVDNVEYTYQRKIDKSLKDKMATPSYRNGFLYLLLKKWKETQGIIEKKVSDSKNEVLFRSNPLFEFLSTYEADNTGIKFSILFDLYKVDYSALTKTEFYGFLRHTPFKVREDDSNGHQLLVKKIKK